MIENKDASNKMFRGKIVIFYGDFRQYFLVIPF